MSACLNPAEIQRRHQALMNAFWNSRGTTRADDAAGAGAISVSPDAKKGTPRCVANLPPVVASPAVFLRGVVTVVSYEFARRWALSHAVCSRRDGLDLKAVNARRKALGLLPFALRGDA